jgi:ElaA protein
MLNIKVKTFKALTNEMLYAILQLRSEIFVVEQNCVYQDLDGNDAKALHILGYKNEKLVAYTRAFKSGDYFKEASIGRVVVKAQERALKYGYAIMEASIRVVETEYKEKTIKVSAQEHLKTFYGNLGFKQKGVPYLEDGIPHIAMLREELQV